MGSFISESGVYHEGQALPGDTEVPQRPSYFHHWDNGAWVLDLDGLRSTYLQRVDVAAGNARMKYITDIPGQQMTYQEKVRQAQAVKALDQGGDLTPFALITGEVGITAPNTGNAEADARAVADVILARYASWQTIGAAIERVRLTAKAALATINDEDDAKLIVSQIVWP